ncbi:MAG TPA: tetratricopeptide repeat protein [Chitinophagales bacterium]|nr:tetratricopeptide repeat protein [Chitinophagales bacterium]
MTAGQVTLIFLSAIATGAIYLFAPLLPPEKKNPRHAAAASAENNFDFESYKTDELKKLPAGELEKYEQLQTAFATAGNKQVMLNEIASLLDSNKLHLMAAFTRKEAAAYTNNDSAWGATAKELYSLAYATDNQPLTQYVLSQVIACYERALELNAENTDAKMSLAMAYLEGQTDPMKGVMLLREITDKDPDNITANLILGKYGIVSGQFDKAVQRLQKVLSVDSLNVDAYLYLAEAYEGMGDKAKAIETLEQCKKIVQDSGFSQQISNYIEKLKNS